jgi:hypothetical protein
LVLIACPNGGIWGDELKVAQLQDNLASLELDLSAEQVKSLDEASSVEPGFPHYLYNAQMTRALAYGGMRDRIVA